MAKSAVISSKSRPPVVLVFWEPKRAGEIQRYIAEGKPEITSVLSSADWKLSDHEVAFLVFGSDTIDYVAHLRRGVKVATLERRVALSGFAPLDLAIQDWIEAAPSSATERLSEILLAGGRFTPALWEDAKKALLRIAPQMRVRLERTARVVEQSSNPVGEPEQRTAVMERDALAVALEAWGGSSARKEAMLDAEPITGPAPFLKNLSRVAMRENSAIEHDAKHVPGFELLKPRIVDVAEFYAPGSKLTVINANMKPLEQALGVDLIYYNHLYSSFILIQYKRMASKVGGRPCYRPDSDQNFAVECERIERCMEEYHTPAQIGASRADVYRLSDSPFYFKFCDTSEVDAFDTSLVPGFYLPYDLMKLVLRSRAAKGPKGGAILTWDTSRRYFSNGKMMDLLRNGWIGSKSSVTESIGRAITLTLSSGRSLIYAASSSSTRITAVRRDVIGRYAPASDPYARGEFQ